MDLRELVRKCRQHDRKSQKDLYDRFAGSMFILCRRYMKSQQSSEEVLMNGFFKFFQSIGKFEYRDEASLIAWLKRIMVNECLMELRKESSFLQLAVDEIPDLVDNTGLLEKISSDEIYRLILKLPIGYRTVFNLYALENFTHAEIAVQLGITEGTSKSQFHKARKQLQQMIIAQNEYYAKARSI